MSVARDCAIYFRHIYFFRFLWSCILHSLKYEVILPSRSRERAQDRFPDGEKKCCENVKNVILVNNFLMHQNAFRSDPEHSRDLSSSRLVNYELILASKCDFSKLRKNHAIEIFRWTKNQLEQRRFSRSLNRVRK